LRRADGKARRPPCSAKADLKIPAPCSPFLFFAFLITISPTMPEKKKGLNEKP
jgi:hypothetical protein